MEKALEILKHIEELYVEDPDFSKIERMAYANPERVNAWVEAFKDYDLSDVLTAVDEYWRYTSNKSKPTVAKLEAMLNAKKVTASDNSLRARILKCANEMGDNYGKAARDRYIQAAKMHWPDIDISKEPWQEPVTSNKNCFQDYASSFMARDIKLGRNRHLLSVYQKAVRYIAEEMLVKEIGSQEWKQLDFAGKCEKAMSLGLFNDFDNALVYICKKYWCKEYQYASANMLKPSDVSFDSLETLGTLAGHFRIGA